MLPMTIAEASRRIARKELSPVELTEAYIERIERLNPVVSAFIAVAAERALADANAAEARIMTDGPRTPLDGIPIAHKDLFDVAGIPTTCHSRLLQGNVARSDATVVVRLARAGTVMLGKLAMYEFALNGSPFEMPWPPARNPWGLECSTSGSSSGTASALAAGLILGGSGSDTGGSIRSPAALCGTSGIKPTYGRCSRKGAFPLAYSLDHIGPMAWTAEDSAILLQEMAGFDQADPASADVPVPDYLAEIGRGVKGLRVGVIRHFFEEDSPVSPETAKGIEASLDLLRSAGAEIRDVTLSSLRAYSATNRIIMNCEAAAIHEHWLRARAGGYSQRLRYRLVLAATLKSTDYIQALRRRRELCREFAVAMEELDLLVTAISNGEAGLMRETSMWDGLLGMNFAAPWNLTGYPAMSVCTGFGPKGLPLAVQIGGKPFAEGTVLRAAYLLEQMTPWRERRPVLDS